MKRLGAFLLSLIILSSFGLSIFANNGTNYKAELASADFTVNAKSAMLIEANTGAVLFEQNADESASPASVTKIMTLLLVMEALEEEKAALEKEVEMLKAAARDYRERFMRLVEDQQHVLNAETELFE